MLPHFVLMPGLYGTGELFEPFIAALPAGASASMISYPPDASLGFPDLVDVVLRNLPGDKKYVLIAESFSGPIALRVAASAPKGLCAVVMSASFVKNPVSGMLGLFQRHFGALFSGISPPEFALRYLLLGEQAPHSLVNRTADIVHAFNPRLVSNRVEMVLDLNVVNDLRRSRYPLLYLRGTQDRLIRSAIADEMLLIRPDMRLCDVDGPHFLLQVRPRECWQAIQQFLADAGLEETFN